MAQKYHRLNIVLHWLIFILVVFTYYSGWNKALPLHRFLGALVLVFALIRLFTMHLWRRKFAPLPQKPWEKLVASLTKIALALLFIIVPLLGIVFRMYYGLDLVFFGYVVVPHDWVGYDPTLGNSLRLWHLRIAYFALFLLAIHAAIACYHQFVKKDKLLERML
ncbi:cytochrome b [Psittacicella gerlachiana]|nr:cytochrome b/b6 domain-containing protein [Psittacicella gerlachiana]